jgi:hypothetical protein
MELLATLRVVKVAPVATRWVLAALSVAPLRRYGKAPSEKAAPERVARAVAVGLVLAGCTSCRHSPPLLEEGIRNLLADPTLANDVLKHPLIARLTVLRTVQRHASAA